MTPPPAPQNARAVLDKAASEDALLTAIVEAALWYQWQVFHIRRSDKALAMGTPGFPDVVLAKAGRVFFWELKSEKGQLSEEQFAWGHALAPVQEMFQPNRLFAIIRPADLDAALAELARP